MFIKVKKRNMMFQLILDHRFQQFDSLSAVKTWDVTILK